MNDISRIFQSLSLIVGLAACAPTTSGTAPTDSQLASFQEGRTTAAQVLAALGPPTSDAYDSTTGQRTLGYAETRADVKGESFIPIVGVFAGGVNAQSRSVVLTFDKRGVLVGRSVSKSAIESTPFGGVHSTTPGN
jgi:outer membrane protein assembly factor BamE (lipoprotein component of BamABCDE complex)